MVKVDNCCCCLSVGTGTKIIGFLLVLDLIGELNHPTVNHLRWALKLFVAGVFLFMLIRDSKFSRMLFFFTYLANVFLHPVVNGLTDDSDDPESDQAWRSLDLSQIAKETCEKMSVQDR